MAMIYTVDFEYKGGTYLAQVEAVGPQEVLSLWLEQTSDKELARWSTKRSAVAQHLIHKVPVAIEGLKGVWCVSGTINENFALANIIATSEVT